MDGIKRGDSTAIAALYANDAWALPPNMEPVKGSAIAGLWGAVIRMGIKDAKFMTDEVTGNGEILAETAHYEMYGADNKLLDKGKYVVVWKPVNGEWKLYRDIWNSSMPAAK
jgi:ketosteroid isomerase-like protein